MNKVAALKKFYHLISGPPIPPIIEELKEMEPCPQNQSTKALERAGPETWFNFINMPKNNHLWPGKCVYIVKMQLNGRHKAVS